MNFKRKMMLMKAHKRAIKRVLFVTRKVNTRTVEDIRFLMDNEYVVSCSELDNLVFK